MIISYNRSMLNLLEKYYLNPFFIYIVSFVICFAWTGFDVSNLVGLAGFAIFGMIPAFILVIVVVGLVLF